MALVWIQAGECGNEATVEARRTDVTHVALEFITTCKHIQELAVAMKALDIAHEMSAPLTETTTYRLATQYVCRNSCIVPAAILKALEVEAGIFLPMPSQIEFVEGAFQRGETPAVPSEEVTGG